MTDEALIAWLRSLKGLGWSNEAADRIEALIARADQAEAALAAQIEADAEIADGFSDCQYRAIEMCVEAIRAQPQDRTALDRYREKVLREAADELRGYGYSMAIHTILALIEKEPTHE